MRLRLATIAAVAAAAAAAPTALAAGGPDPEIAALQVSLRSKGMYFGKIDGVAGPMTAKGLRAFQRAAGLPVTGELGPRTRARLGALGRPLVARRVLVQGSLRLGRLVASVSPRPRGASPAARRRRPLRRLDESRARPFPAHSPACRRRDRRPGDVDGVRARTAYAGPGAGDEVDHQLHRAAGRHAHRDRGEAQDDRACARRRQRPRVREPRRRGSEAPSARVRRSRSGRRAEPLDRSLAHRQVGGALRHLRQPRPCARVAGVRLPDERDLVDRRLGADADHARHLGVRRNRPPRAHACRGRARAASRWG